MSTITQQREEANLAVVGEIYASFARGDVPSILAVIGDDCAWESWTQNLAQDAGIDYMQRQTGPAGVAAFFDAVSRFQIHLFEVLDMFAGGNKVAVEVLIDATSPGGGRFCDEELHLYTLDDEGKVTRMRHYVDTAKHIAASRGEGTAASG